MNETIHWVRDSDNIITLQLFEEEAGTELPIAGIWNELRFTLSKRNHYPEIAVEILRLGETDGVRFANGTLEIQPAALLPSEINALATLDDNERHRAIIRIKSSSNPHGIHFGEDDSDDRVYVIFHTPP